MIPADLIVTGARELVTCAPATAPAPGTGSGTEGSAGSGGVAGVIPGGALAAKAGRIVFVGGSDALRREVTLEPGGVELDASGRCVLPGLVDPHTHLPFAGWREADYERRLRGESYAEIARTGGGILTTVRATRAASEADLAGLGRARLDRMLLHGTTTIEAKSGYGLTREDELKQLRALARLRDHPVEVFPTLLAAHVVPPEYRDNRDEWVRFVAEELVPEVARERLAVFCDVFVDQGAYTPDEARVILEAAGAAGLRARVHAEQLSRSGGAALAARLRAASADHLEHVNPRDARALAGSGTVAILLPGASFFSGAPGPSGVAGGGRGAPGRMLLDAGVPVAIASDFNPGTCPCESVAAMIPLACLLCGLSPDEAIVAATRTAAVSLGAGDRIGTLEAGKQADVAIFDVTDRRHLAYRFGTNHCRDVVKAGRQVVRDGRLAA